MKPKMTMPVTDDNYGLVEKAGSVLARAGRKQEEKDLHQAASIVGYDLYHVLKLLDLYVHVVEASAI